MFLQLRVPNRFRLPVGSEVVGCRLKLGELYLEIRLSKSELLEDRTFWALTEGYMERPNLAGVDVVCTPSQIYWIFEE